MHIYIQKNEKKGGIFIKKIAVLSPHLDDGVLSCGDYIAHETAIGNEVTIITIFTGYPSSVELSDAAKIYHSNCFLSDDSMRYRKNEDIAACDLLNCKYLHLDFFECLYRRKANGDYVYSQLSNIYYLDFEDTEGVELLFEKLSCIVSQFDILLAPLGLGNHADHLLTCAIVKKWLLLNDSRELFAFMRKFRISVT